jgi:CheY-like chemotaxis protein
MKTALLVDGDPATNAEVKRALEKVKVYDHIITAENGLKALEILNEYFESSKQLPSLIVLDLKIPLVDGFEFLEVIQKLSIQHKIDIIVSCTSDHSEDLEKAKQMGVTQCFIKPFSADKLTACIKP